MLFCMEIRLVSDDIRFAGVLEKSAKTTIQFEGGRRRKYTYGVSRRAVFRAPVNGRGRCR